MDRNWNGDFHVMNKAFYHFNNSVESAHVTCCAFRNTQDYWGFFFFSSAQNSLSPLQVINVVLTYCIFSFECFVQHVFHRYQWHGYSPPKGVWVCLYFSRHHIRAYYTTTHVKY
uniref:Uncharacterized protein n=1 Tax=Paenibacillus polymyxa TaxID=1406 RepID=B0FAZ5_PAEPO|nr:hypothetical protein [Paenibacillus polymyxa]